MLPALARIVDSGLVQSASMRSKMPVLAMPGCAAKNSTPLTPAACARFCSSCAEQGRARLSPPGCWRVAVQAAASIVQQPGRQSPGRPVYHSDPVTL